MPGAAALTGAEIVPLLQGGANVQSTAQDIANLAAANPTGANPTATAGPAAVNGSAATFMRSDGAPAIQKASSSLFGIVEVDGTTITASAGVISAVQPSGANPSGTAGPTAVNGSAATFMRSDGAPAVQKASNSQFGLVEGDGTTITIVLGVASVVNPAPSAANPTATASDVAVNGSAATFMRSDAAPAVQKGSSSAFGLTKVDNASVFAAAGVLSVAAFINYVANNFYTFWAPGTVVNSTAAGSQNTIRWCPVYIPRPVTLSALGVFVNTISGGGNLQVAIYANAAATARPTGAALASTANLSTGTSALVSGAISLAITAPGIYWIGVNCDNSVVQIRTLNATGFQSAGMVGTATEANLGSLLTGPSFTTSQTFGSWPSGPTLAESNATNIAPFAYAKIASVP